MNINGLNIPKKMLEVIRTGLLFRETGSWKLKTNTDSYGNHLETELGEFFNSEISIKEATKNLPKGFEPNESYGNPNIPVEGPGSIPDITDFSQVICFAISGDGSPFCLDFRESKDDPSIIWWDDTYWRKISPNFDSFLSLFNIDDIA